MNVNEKMRAALQKIAEYNPCGGDEWMTAVELLQKWAREALLATPPESAYPTGSDREVLRYLMQQFDAESWQCPKCGHAEDCATMDSADYLRRYLATPPESAQGAKVWAPTPTSEMLRLHLGEMSDETVKRVRTGYELALRLQVPKPSPEPPTAIDDDALTQALTDPENQPSQWGTVPYSKAAKPTAAECCRTVPCKHPGIGPCDMPAKPAAADGKCLHGWLTGMDATGYWYCAWCGDKTYPYSGPPDAAKPAAAYRPISAGDAPHCPTCDCAEGVNIVKPTAQEGVVLPEHDHIGKTHPSTWPGGSAIEGYAEHYAVQAALKDRQRRLAQPAAQEGELPPLPFSPYLISEWAGPEVFNRNTWTAYTAEQMRAYGEQCRAQPVGEVDEAMVERAIRAFWPVRNEKRLKGDYRQPGAFALGMHAALTAALRTGGGEVENG